MNKMAVFVFWEKNGIVREYIKVYLKGLKEICKKIYVVVNGNITDEGKSILEDEIGACVIVRENVGVDFWAYKTAIDYEGENITTFDEVVLCNCSCYGPIYPFSEMFSIMAKKDIDFWGITEWPLNEAGYTGTWILSYFMVFRKSVFSSKYWKQYWENLSFVNSREECILQHETKFTKFFSDRGFSYDVYCENSPLYIDMTIEAPEKLVIQQRCPIIKRKAFCSEYNRFLSYHRGDASKKVFEYIQKNNLYDTDIIVDDLLATQHYSYLKNCFHLNYFLPSDYKKAQITYKPKAVVCFHLYYEELLDSCFHYIKQIPQYIDLVITSPKSSILEKVKEKIQIYDIKNNTTMKLIDARGRAESAFLVATKDFILDYEYACIVHDKKSSFLRPGCIGVEFGLQNQDSLLKSELYIENILNLFKENPRLGILEPINLIYANYRDLYGNEWGANYEGTVELLKKSGIDLPIDYNVPPIAPMGAMFWFRTKCMKKLIEMNWNYEDFPQEPLPLDGSLIHIIERAYPFFAQDAGYFIAWVSSIEDAQIHLTNITHLYREKNIMFNNLVANHNVIQSIMSMQGNIGLKKALKEYIKKKVSLKKWEMLKKIYYKFGGKPI